MVAPVPGLVMIAGGKYTTYRVMARDAVDAAAPRSAARCRPASPTSSALVGADGFETRTNQRGSLARRSGLHVARIDHLLGRFGGLVDEVLGAGRRSDPTWRRRSRRRGLPARPRSSTP